MQNVDLFSHKFYFGDLAVPPTGETGEVIGIWLKECHDGQGFDGELSRTERWMYRLKGLSRCGASRRLTLWEAWWPEDQLQRPSEVKHGPD